MDIAQAHRDALTATERIVTNLAPPDFGHATPCDGWDVGEVLHHLVYGNLWVPPLVEGETVDQVGDRFEGDILGEDFLIAYRGSAELAASAFEVESALEAPCAVPNGPISGAMYAGRRFIEVLIHGWDLAVASGQDATLSSDLVEACYLVVDLQLEWVRASGEFGEPLEVPDDADAQTTLLGLLGRAEQTDRRASVRFWEGQGKSRSRR